MTAIILPAIMDRATLNPLATELAECCDKGQPLRVDGAKVSRIGLAGLQLLVCAALAAKDRDLAFEIADPSEELAGAAALSGLTTMFGLPAEGSAA